MFNNRLTQAMRCKWIHLIGIGGSGMNGIAELLLHYGYKVTGSDLQVSRYTTQLTQAGATIYYNHQAQNIGDAEVVVYSSAITEDNPELIAARARHLSIIPRAQMLAEIMRFNVGIAIAGTHGKTTTTSLVAHILTENGTDPAYVIGGILNSSHRSAQAGKGVFFVVEADESDGSFLRFNPVMSVVTNIDRDHLTNYHMQMSELKTAFIHFLHRLPFYGLAVLCYDDPNVRELLPIIDRRLVTYGFQTGAQLYLSDFQQEGFTSSFKITWPKYHLMNYPVRSNLIGRHNALNAAAALVVATLGCGLPVEAVVKSLASFEGVGRRMQQHGFLHLKQRQGKVLLIEDYGHHPQEIAATIAALKTACPAHRLVMLFQPHRYSRTSDLWQDFVTVLQQVDVLLLLDIYPANEPSIQGVTSAALAKAISTAQALSDNRLDNKVACFQDLKAALDTMATWLQDGDVILVQGAGNVNRAVKELLDMYGRQEM